MTENQTPAGWYADPAGDQTKMRFWDGQSWTDQFTDAAVSNASTFAAAPGQPAGVSTAAPVNQYGQYNQAQQPSYNYQQQPQYQQAPFQQAPVQPAAPAGKDPKMMAIIGLVCGVVGLLVGFFVSMPVGIALGIPAIILGAKGRKSSMKALGLVSLILGILVVVVCAAVMILVIASAL